MDSINQNQSEENHADLTGAEAVEKVRDLVKKAGSCFFRTAQAVEGSSESRPMAALQVDDNGNLWFLSAADSHKNVELGIDSAVELYFQASSHSGFLMLRGTGIVSKDKAKIKELWEPTFKTWFTEGEEDPRITVIQVAPSDGYYWDTKHGKVVSGVKILIGAALGKTLDDSIEGKLTF